MGHKARKRIVHTDALRKKEMAHITALQKEHGYVLGDVKPGERYTNILTFSTGRMQVGRAVKVVAPEGSALYRAFVEHDDGKEKEAEARKAKRKKRARRKETLG